MAGGSKMSSITSGFCVYRVGVYGLAYGVFSDHDELYAPL